MMLPPGGGLETQLLVAYVQGGGVRDVLPVLVEYWHDVLEGAMPC